MTRYKQHVGSTTSGGVQAFVMLIRMSLLPLLVHRLASVPVSLSIQYHTNVDLWLKLHPCNAPVLGIICDPSHE